MNPAPAECARLAAELRALQQRSGISLAALARSTSFSKSSWHRYLSGTALPPWQAVHALSELADEPQERMHALWRLAEGAWSGRAAVAPKTPSQPAPPRPVRAQPTDVEPAPAPARPGAAAGTVAGSAPGSRYRRRAPLLKATLAIAAGCVGVGAMLLTPKAGKAPTPAQTTAAGFHVLCTGRACDGLDPGAMFCGVEPDTLLHQVTQTGVGVEIRYNPQCGAAWARIWNSKLGDALTLSEPGRPTQHVTVEDASLANAFVYTPLLAVDGPLTACLTTPAGARTCYAASRP